MAQRLTIGAPFALDGNAITQSSYEWDTKEVRGVHKKIREAPDVALTDSAAPPLRRPRPPFSRVVFLGIE